MKKVLTVTSLVLLVASTDIVYAQFKPREFYGEGYTIINETPLENDDLKQIINKPINATNIKDGILRVLDGTGWRLANDAALSSRINYFYSAPWPDRWRMIGPDSLNNVLNTIAGEGWQVVVDPVNRLIGFEIKPQYRDR